MKLTPEEVKARIVTNFPKLGTEYAGIAEDAIELRKLAFDDDQMEVYKWGRSVGWDHRKSVDYTIRVSPPKTPEVTGNKKYPSEGMF